MREVLTIEEINARYPDEWVLIDNPQMSRSHKILGGSVAFHSKDRDKAYRAANRLPVRRRFATIFTGVDSDDVVYML